MLTVMKRLFNCIYSKLIIISLSRIVHESDASRSELDRLQIGLKYSTMTIKLFCDMICENKYVSLFCLANAALYI